MAQWVYTVQLQGHTAGDKRTMRFPLATDHITLDLALADALAIHSALVALTKAYVSKESLSYVISEDNQVPADESADCFEELAVACYLNLTTVAEKLWIARVPAPENSVFLSDAQTLDPANALVQAYIGQIEDLVEVSDEETLQSDGRTNEAVKAGWKISRAKTFRS